MARHLKIQRVSVDPVGKPVWPAAQAIVHRRWTPMVDTQSGAIERLFQLAREQGAEAVLTGFGGDVLFRGLGLELSLARRGKLLTVQRHFWNLSRGAPVSVVRLWYTGVVRPLILGGRALGMEDAQIHHTGSSVRGFLIHTLKQAGQGWLIESVEQAGSNALSLESPFYGAGFLAAFARVGEEGFARSRSHEGVLRELARPHLPEFVVNRVRKADFNDYHRTWLALERDTLSSRYRELRPLAPDSLDLPPDISHALNASNGPDSFSASWMALTILEFLVTCQR
jgi:asparagine synthetase B (glutamine-hydrolysing)